MKNALQKLGDAIKVAIDEDFVGALQIVGSAHISLMLAYVRLRGESGDENKQITIEDSSTGRIFTISAMPAIENSTKGDEK